MSEKFYCLSWDGDLYALGYQVDWTSAESRAQDRGLMPVWVFGEKAFNTWRETLNHFAEKGE